MLIEHLKNIHDINKDSMNDFTENVKKIRLDFDYSTDDENNNEASVNETANDKLSTKQLININEKLMRLILKKNLSFNIVDCQELQDLLDAIRPSFYKLPCRQTVRNTLLPKLVRKFEI